MMTILETAITPNLHILINNNKSVEGNCIVFLSYPEGILLLYSLYKNQGGQIFTF